MGARNHLKLIASTVLAIFAVLTLGGLALAADPAAGKTVYEKNSCGACHGAKGEGAMGPALAGISSAKFVEVTRAGTAKGMPGFGEDKIAKADMDNLAAFVETLSPAAAPASAKVESAPAAAKVESAPAKAPVAVKAEAPSKSVEPVKAPIQTAAQPAAAPAPKAAAADHSTAGTTTGTGFDALTIEQKYATVVAAIGALFLLIFLVVLNGPLRLPRPS